MILKLAWRNIWRNRTRSFVILIAITLGIIASLFLDAFAQGMVKSFIENSIEKVTSHIQIHGDGYLIDEDIKNHIPQADKINDELRNSAEVRSHSSRTIVNAMISSSRTSQNIKIKAIDLEDETSVTDIHQQIKEGEFLSQDLRNKIFISTRLAERLSVKVGSKTVITFMDMDNEITAGLFRIIGLYDSSNNNFDEVNVFMMKKDLMNTMDPAGEMSTIPQHEIAILLKEKDNIENVLSTLKRDYPDLDIQPYDEIAPELGLYESQMDFITWFYFIIIMFALIFGIINTMLMAVLDRYKEFGVLMAVGLGKTKLFFLVMVETIMLCLVAAPLGMFMGYIIISFFSKRGIDLSMWSEMLEEYGMLSMVYPELNSLSFYRLTAILIITAIIAALYPSLKAIRLNPLEAIRKI